MRACLRSSTKPGSIVPRPVMSSRLPSARACAASESAMPVAAKSSASAGAAFDPGAGGVTENVPSSAPNRPSGTTISPADSFASTFGAPAGPRTVASRTSRPTVALPARVAVPSVGSARIPTARSRSRAASTLPVRLSRAVRDATSKRRTASVPSSPTRRSPPRSVLPAKMGPTSGGSRGEMRAPSVSRMRRPAASRLTVARPCAPTSGPDSKSRLAVQPSSGPDPSARRRMGGVPGRLASRDRSSGRRARPD